MTYEGRTEGVCVEKLSLSLMLTSDLLILAT